jgi:hypothetical protein
MPLVFHAISAAVPRAEISRLTNDGTKNPLTTEAVRVGFCKWDGRISSFV